MPPFDLPLAIEVLGATRLVSCPQAFASWSDDLLKATQLARTVRRPARHLVWLFVILALLIGWGAVIAEIAAERRDAEDAAIVRSQDRATLLQEHVGKTLQVAALASLHLGQSYL